MKFRFPVIYISYDIERICDVSSDVIGNRGELNKMNTVNYN